MFFTANDTHATFDTDTPMFTELSAHSLDTDIPMSPCTPTTPIRPSRLNFQSPAFTKPSPTRKGSGTHPKSTKPRLPHRRPTTLLLSPTNHRRVSPAKSQRSTKSDSSRRARIYSNQHGALSPPHVGSRVCHAPPSPTAQRNRPSHHAKKASGTNAKALSLGVLGRIHVGAVLRPLKRLTWGVSSGKVGGISWSKVSRKRTNDAQGEGNQPTSSTGLHGFALAQSKAMQVLGSRTAAAAGEGDVEILLADGDEDQDQDDDDDNYPYSPMPTSPLYPVSREDCGVTEPQTSFNHLFQQPDFMAFEPDQPHSPALDPLLEAPSTSTPMEDVEDEDDDDEVHQYCYIPSTSSPTSPQLCGFGQSGCGGDAEMDNHPISPVTSYSLSPVSISSSMKRARSRGKTMRILGYEAHEAYSCGIQFSTAVPMGQGKKRAYFN